MRRGRPLFALEYGELVAHYEDHGVLRQFIHPVDANRFEEAVDEAVEEGERHRQRASPSPVGCI
jgi:hypothetical protein